MCVSSNYAGHYTLIYINIFGKYSKKIDIAWKKIFGINYITVSFDETPFSLVLISASKMFS